MARLTRSCARLSSKQYGKIVNTASAAGLYGNVGQANYSAAKMGLVAFTKTLAREGAKYGIAANVIAPMAATQMLATVLPQEMLDALKPEFVAPLVGVLTAREAVGGASPISGRIFEVGAGFVAEVRWERSMGVVFRTDDSFTPSAVKAKFAEIGDFTNAEHPESMTDKDMMVRRPPPPSAWSIQLLKLTCIVDLQTVLKSAASLPSNPQAADKVSFAGQTVVITGAGAGLGRAYAHMFARLGAGVVVNDVSQKGAEAVVDEVVKGASRRLVLPCCVSC